MTIDLQTVLRGLLKGLTVTSIAMDRDTATIVLEDEDGRSRVLELRDVAPAAPAPAPADDGLLPFRQDAAAIIPPPVTQPAPPAAPTTMAKKGMVSFEPTFDIIRQSAAQLNSEAKDLLAELKKAELRIGDDALLLQAATAARRGDLVPLRELAEKRRQPLPHAGAPPH